MRSRITPRLTYANVVSSIALFAVLGGGAYAASTIGPKDIAKNAVRAKHIKKRQVRTKHIQDRAVTNPKLATGAVNASTVQNGSLGTGEFASSIPTARVTRSGAQSIEDSVETFIEFDSERYDTAAMHDNNTNNTRLTAPVDGIYVVTAQISWPFDPDGYRQLAVVKNGTTTVGFAGAEPIDGFGLQVTTQVQLEAGEFVGAQVFQDSGGFLSVTKSDEWSPELAMTWLAPG